MSVSTVIPRVVSACVGLPDEEAKALRRYLLGNRKGSVGAAIQPSDVAKRLHAALRDIRMQEDAIVGWLRRHGQL